uniref:PWWP domain-containing protein n=1 Tax=Graphocephala atropunctata TaxID=36148 RepID=A0A1B6M7W3_9HEMI
MMTSPKFGPGDKIFAKVRGYPPWPARVEGVADETPNKMKYHVYFYGTGETAVCKQEELFPYVDNREKFGKPMKKKGFNEALLQIDSELGLSTLIQTPQTPNNEPDSETEGNLVIDEAPGKKSKVSTPLSGKPKDVKRASRGKADAGDEQVVKKPRKKSVLPSEEDTPGTSQKLNSVELYPVVSRSGRKIKPKKYSDVDSHELEDTEQATPKGKQGTKATSASSKTKHDIELDADLINESTLVAFTPKGEEVRLKLNLNKPVVFKSEKARLEWEAKVLEDGKTLKAQIESGEVLPEKVKKEIQEKYQDKLVQLEQKMAYDDKKEKLEYLKVEAQLLDIDVRIKGSLSLKHAEPETCLKCIDEFLGLKLSPLMFKKHPELVDTVKKLRKYVGNTNYWNMSDEQTHVFAGQAASIRSKSEHIYNKIKSLFMVPYGKSFWDIFSQELKDFNESIKGMGIDEIFGLTNDPSPKENMENESPADVNSSAS